MRSRLASVLRQRREAAGLTQAAVASRAGISRQLLVKIEAGHVRAEIGKVMQVVKALDATWPSRMLRHPPATPTCARSFGEP
jgi:transcriptional regulator with XRE-family HTH domain